jgi:hypothetical protein
VPPAATGERVDARLSIGGAAGAVRFRRGRELIRHRSTTTTVGPSPCSSVSAVSAALGQDFLAAALPPDPDFLPPRLDDPSERVYAGLVREIRRPVRIRSALTG